MGRKKLNKDWWAARLTPETSHALDELIKSMGFIFKKDVDGQPQELAAKTEWLEAIASGEIILYKKVTPPLDDQK